MIMEREREREIEIVKNIHSDVLLFNWYNGLSSKNRLTFGNIYFGNIAEQRNLVLSEYWKTWKNEGPGRYSRESNKEGQGGNN